ncbi:MULTISPECIES: fimbria/pilus outer membrane usher protein [Roseomonadaceae]|uniref:Fimbrial biogenesis outer membrane usher protein n=1 Tax=Falsiroseomonas oleicola TaxID=2801474 RepID=A0ABS6H9L1_9PROT|nr:fimbria/pilus outer membrane usher protein [Roseomonas oleicola]MBU8545386.1 fimbrial biogenesis outer membrane usher protein [Roseomonas oleicola]
MAVGLGCLVLSATSGLGAEPPLFLEIVVNGNPSGQVGEFIQDGAEILARPRELRALGFVLPQALREEEEPIALSRIPGVQARINVLRQTLMVTADDSARRPSELFAGGVARMGPLTAAGWGAVLNYDVLGTFADAGNYGGAFLEARAFGPHGTLSASALSSYSPQRDQNTSFARLETLYTYAEPEELRRWRVGDVISGALGWSRAVRLGGGQVSTDFGLRPDLVSYPLPVFGGSAALPSTVDVLVNGIRSLSLPVQPGPFQLRSLPVVTGAGDVLMTVTDALGRQTVVSLPFYASTALLRPGLASYSLEAGGVRRRFGLDDSDYGEAAGSGSLRYGLTDWLTLEGHAEGSDGFALGGVGAALRIGNLGILTAAVATSSGGETGLRGDTASEGTRVAIGVERRTRRFNVFASGTLGTAGYRDIAALNGTPMPRQTLRAGAGLSLGSYGSLSIGYIGQQAGPSAQRQAASSYLGGALVGASDVSLVTASYSARIAGRVNFYVTGYNDLRRDDSYGVSMGVSMSFGGGRSGGVSTSIDDGRSGFRTQLQQAAQVPGDTGFRLYDQEGQYARRMADADHILPFAHVTAGIDQSSLGTAGRVGARGALVAAGGGVFAANTIHDSFAVVSSGDVPDVRVLYENRPVGSTDSNGRLLVPYLGSFRNNRLALEPADLPPDVEVDRTQALVRPGDRVGVIVDFGVRRSRSALLRLQDGQGAPLPLGARLHREGLPPTPIGYDGESFVTELRPTNTAEVELPDGRRCRITFTYRPVPGDVPVIGPLPCQ